MPIFTPELELLLYLTAPVKPVGVESERIARLIEGVAENSFSNTDDTGKSFFDFAYRHGLAALAQRHAASLTGNNLANFTTHATLYAHRTAIRNICLTDNLCTVLHAFETHGIQALPFKGAAIAQAAYDDIALRRFIDIDLVVAPNSLAAAVDLLLPLGYEPAHDLDAKRLADFARTEYNLAFRRAADNSIIELHWRLTPRYFDFDLPFADIWQRRRNAKLLNYVIDTLSHEDCLLALCAHGAKHGWSKLMWVRDVAGLIRRHRIDWRQVEAIVKTDYNKQILLSGLALAHALYECPLPAQLMHAVHGSSIIKRLTARTVARLGVSGNDLSYGEIFKYHVALHPTFYAKARYAVRVATLPSVADTVAGAPRNVLTSSVMRPLRLAKVLLLSRNRDRTA